MQRTAVSSSNIVSIGYDEENNVLEIEFHHGGIYQYMDVEKSTFLELMSSSSQGKYFMSKIKDFYHCDKVN